MEYTLGRAVAADLPGILGLFDLAIEWMVARGNTKQWGTEPASDDPRWGTMLGELIERGELLVARAPDGTLLGSIAVSGHPPLHYVHVWDDRPGDAGYVEAFVTHRQLGRGLGSELLRHAEAGFAAEGRALCRLDCSAADPGLRSYYEREGYTAVGSAPVGPHTIWLLEKRL